MAVDEGGAQESQDSDEESENYDVEGNKLVDDFLTLRNLEVLFSFV